jgi:hypothetical protein
MSPALRDIHGLDGIPWWPPATGWWLLALASIMLLLVLALWARRLLRFPPGSWRSEARSALLRLRKRHRGQSPKKSALELSELLRRTTMVQFGRERLASLSGESWLQWLKETDPEGFDWVEHGRLLTCLPYAREGTPCNDDEMARLIEAALKRIAHRDPGAEAKRNV